MEEAQIAPPAREGKGHHNIDDNDDDLSFATDEDDDKCQRCQAIGSR